MQILFRSFMAVLMLCGVAHAQDALRASPSSLRFGDQPVGVTSGPMAITFTNSGSTSVNVSGLVLAPLSVFARSGGTCGPVPFAVAPGSNCTVEITFRPDRDEEFDTTIYFFSGPTGNGSLSLTGKGVAGRLQVSPFGGIRFFDTRVGESSNVQSAQVSNSGDYLLQVLSITGVDAPFVRVGGSCGTPPFTLQSGQSCSLDYVFSPVEVAQSRQTVRFTSTAYGSPPSLDIAGDSDPGRQTLTFPTQSAGSRGFAANGTFAIAPLATSASPNSGQPIVYSSLTGNVCTVSASTVTMAALGTCTLAANQGGNANYNAAAQVTQQVQLIARSDADLWVENTSDVMQAEVGDTVAYTILVGNHGPFDAVAVNVLDLPPTRLGSVVWQCVGAVGTACPQPSTGEGAIDLTLNLPDGASARFELLGTVLPASTPGGDATVLLNTASVSLQAGSPLTDPVTHNNQSAASVSVVSYTVHVDGFEGPLQR